ncbi:MAG: cytochrome P450 [Pseudomonadota bacterium]
MTVTQPKIQADSHALGDAESVWFKLAFLLKDPNDPMQMLLRLSQKYKGAVPINLKGQKIVFLSDVEHCKHVLVKNADNYLKYFDGLKPIFGKSMITIDGALWQKIRKPQQAAFHPAKFEEYFPYLIDAIDSKVKRWDALAESGETVEMVEETWTLAADMVCKALFDREMPFNPHFIFGAVKAYTNVMNHKSIRMKKVTGEEFEITQEDAGKAMETWGNVPDSVLNAQSIEGRTSTLLSMLEEAKADPDFPEFDHQQVVDEMKQYLWAGTETTALTLAWCLYLLTQHPEVADNIREEANRVCGDRAPNWDEVQYLSYTKHVIQETMRLYPPVWALIRVAADEDEIDGNKISAGDNVILCSYAIHRNAEYWTNPEAFDPTRFSPDRMKKRAKFSYLPFGAGKRACIGGALSQIENVLALVQLLRRFQPEYVGEVPARIHPTVTLTPKGLPFRIKKL